MIAQGGSEAAGTDILARARRVLDGKATPSASLCMGLVAEVERLRGALDGLATELQAHVHTTPSDEDHEIICDVESTIAHRIRDVLRGER